MFGPDWTEGCPACSFWADGFDRAIVHLNHRDVLLQTRHAGRRAVGAEYDPDRWLDGADSVAPDQKTFLPFGAGPRFCPGRNLAFLEAKTALAMLARNFEVELDAGAGPVHERFSFTMIPEGLRVRLRPRIPETSGQPSA
jgi:hypothetical protein